MPMGPRVKHFGMLKAFLKDVQAYCVCLASCLVQAGCMLLNAFGSSSNSTLDKQLHNACMLILISLLRQRIYHACHNY